jgi:hypothetical protein
LVSLAAAISCGGSAPLGHRPPDPASASLDGRTTATMPPDRGTAGAAAIGVPGIDNPEGRGVVLECPFELPRAGTACRAAGACTYFRDGPCGANPDQIFVCNNGLWAASLPAIACPGALPADCAAQTIEQYCAGRACPNNLYQARSIACGNFAMHSPSEQLNRCGGTSLRFMIGAGGSIYHYDATRTLVGITVFDEIPSSHCDEGQHVYGRDCLPNQRFCPESSCIPAVCDIGADDDADAGTQ